MTKEEYEHRIEDQEKTIARLKKKNTGWMCAAIILGILFLLTFAMKAVF